MRLESWLFLLASVAFTLSGCDQVGLADSPENAHNETTVRAVVCLIGGTTCFVAAISKAG